MSKRIILAIVLSWVVLFGWSLLAPKSQTIVNKGVIKDKPSQAEQTIAVNDQPTVKDFSQSAQVKFNLDKYDIDFFEQESAVRQIVFKDYQSSVFALKYGLFIDDASFKFKKYNESGDKISFVYSDKDKKIIKEFNFDKSSYSSGLRIIVKNTSTGNLSLTMPIIIGAFDPNLSQTNYYGLTVSQNGKVIHPNPGKTAKFSKAKFLSLADRYFCIIAQPQLNDSEVFVNRVNPKLSEVGFVLSLTDIPPQSEIVKEINIYTGPQDLKLISKANENWASVINYGSFDFISQIILKVLEFLYNLVHNLGLAIVILSVIIYLILYPLTLKQMRSVKAMQALQPKMEELRKQYKDNPQKLNKEVLELYKIHKVNPLGGCLPLLLQIPIFLALYQVLSRSVALKGASFLWIKDLSAPDRLLVLKQPLPFLGADINILPIAVAVVMFLQQRISMASTAGTNAEQQKIMSILFPLIFGALFYRVPSGLVLYWLINSTLMFLYQLKINRTNG